MAAVDSMGRLRAFLMAILLLGMAGSATELLLLAHHEDFKQLIPLSLLAIAFGVLAWHGGTRSRASVRGLQVVMTLFVIAGLAGVILHVRSSMEFQSEVDPSLRGLKLLAKALMAKAPPALAPGVMVQLGLLGLAFTYRHPALLASTHPNLSVEEK